MKRNNFFNTLSLACLLCGCIVTACKKMDHSYAEYLVGGEKRFSKLPDSVMIFPGKERLEFKVLLSDPNIRECRVYWNFKSDSVMIPVDENLKGTDTVSFIIDNLQEGRYEFNIYTVDRAGNFSLSFDTMAMIYGSKYEGALVNRSIVHAELLAGRPRLFWYEVIDSTSVGTIVKYKTQDNFPREVVVQDSDEVTRIAERPLGDSIQITTMYIPTPGAVDTFYGQPETVILLQAEPKELNKSKFAIYDMPSDALSYSGYSVSAMWDNKFHDIGDSYKAGDVEKQGINLPMSVTFDLGVNVALDHFTLWQMGADHQSYFYGNANVKKFEVWGSNQPVADGSWVSWTKLTECEVAKPSGSADNTQQDIDAALKGHDFDFPDGTPEVRYIRIKVLETWKDYPGENRFFIEELSFYGIED